ncbi:DNA primase [Candidatus Margulisiibacteriota bacterium]
MLAATTVEQVKSYSDIVPIISEYVQLKRKGRNYVGFCPFHSEKTASFTVSPEKHIWHCFGCHASGNLISFIMKIDNLSFVEAITTLAKRLGIEVKEDSSSPFYTEEEKNKKQIRDILYEARELYKISLSNNPKLLDYLSQRGISQQSIKRFHLGYAAHDNSLINDLNKKQFSADNIAQSGLFISSNSNSFPRFKNRLIVPIIDYQGRTVAFGGRILDNANNQAKYINSEESLIFNKRKILFGLNQAQSIIREQNFALIMEGYMDVIMAHQYGFQNTVAVMGTALTEPHIQKLKRFTDTLYLAFDNDEAGRTAIQRSLPGLQKFGMKIFIINYSEKDPADFLEKHGAEKFQVLIKNAYSFLDYFYKLCKSRYGIASIEARSKIIQDIIPYLKKEQDPIIQDHYIKKISQDLKIKHDFILAKSKKIATIVNNTRIVNINSQNNKYKKAEEAIIYLIATNLESRKYILETISLDDLIDEKAKIIYRKVQSTNLKNKDLIELLDREEDKSYLTKIIFKGEDYNYQVNLGQLYQDYIQVLKQYQRNNKINLIKDDINKLANSGDSAQNDDKIKKLFLELSELKKLDLNQ